jgi:hypothetical protein
MDHQIHQDTSRPGLVQKPIAQRFFGAVAAASQTKDSGLTNLPIDYSLPGHGILGEEAHHMSNQETDAGFPASVKHEASVRDRARQGLFADDVLAGSGSLQDHIIVEVGGSTDIYDIHLGKHGSQVREDLFAVE